jgi:hypothetical protein
VTLRLIREPSRDLATLGSLYVNDVWQCWTLEDQIREVPDQPVLHWKVGGETAIRSGRYRLVLSRSNRFGYMTPELLHVEGFTGIRIHPGNRRSDSLGCILVGRDRGDAFIAQSRLAFQSLMATLVDAKPGALELLIENPPSYRAAEA